MSSTILDITDLKIFNQQKQLLQLPKLQIKQGEIHSLIGESGSGKSLTLLASIGLLHKKLSYTGGISLFNKESQKYSEKSWEKLRGRRISMVFQEPMSALNPLQARNAATANAVPRAGWRQG